MAKDIYFNNPRSQKKTDSSGFTPPRDFYIEPDYYIESADTDEIMTEDDLKTRRAAVSERNRQRAKEFQWEQIRGDETIHNASWTGQYEQPDAKKSSVKNASSAGSRGKKKKKHIFPRVLCVLLVLVLITAGCGFLAVSSVLKDYTSETLAPNQYIEASALTQSAGVYNVLLLGIDTMDTTASSRSDAMIVMSIDSVHHQIKLSSFMRDMYVTVPGHGDTKLTHACQYGGPQLVADTIEYNFGIKINAYVKIGYEVLIHLVNGLGGITVPEIDQTEASAMAFEGAYVEPGTNVSLTGEEALQYCRIRRGQSDFQRTGRQREMIQLVIKKMLTVNPVQLIKLASSIAAEVQSSIGKAELYQLAFKVLPCLAGDIRSQQIPADGTWENATRSSMAVLLVNFDANRSVLKDFIYGK